MLTMRAFKIVVCSVVAGCLAATALGQSRTLPSFSVKATNGKTYTLASVTKKGPAVLYFIKVGCPINDQAITYYMRIAKAYKGAKVPFYGVINTDLEGFKSWNERFNVAFPVLLDPDKRIIDSWKVAKSPWVIVAGKGGKVVKEWGGYSAPALKELGALIAKGSGVQPKNCDFTGAPSNLRPG